VLLPAFGSSHAPHQSVKPELFVAFWDSDQIAYDVETFSRSGRYIDLPFGSFSLPVLFATDRKHDVFMLDTGRSTISGYAEGSSTPFETIQIVEPTGVLGEDLSVDAQGNFWVAYRCGGPYCATPGNLTEYGTDGHVKQVLAGCLLSYNAVAVDRHGNAFAAGFTEASARITKTKLVEYRNGSTVCQTILRNDVMAAWGGGLQITHSDDLVVDFDAPQNGYLEILGGPRHQSIIGHVQISNGFYTLGSLALTQNDSAIWVGTWESETWTAQKFSYPGGAPLSSAGYLEELYRFYDFAATD
jgi:hypothetical protein